MFESGFVHCFIWPRLKATAFLEIIILIPGFTSEADDHLWIWLVFTATGLFLSDARQWFPGGPLKKKTLETVAWRCSMMHTCNVHVCWHTIWISIYIYISVVHTCMWIINIVHTYCTWFDHCPATRWHDDSPKGTYPNCWVMVARRPQWCLLVRYHNFIHKPSVSLVTY